MKNIRRRAIKCELIEESSRYPGYYKYDVTIKEVDGYIHTVPTYGIDMQDAIKRLLKVEKLDRITKRYEKRVEPKLITFIMIAWVISIILSSVIDDYRVAQYAVSTMFGISTLYAIIYYYKNMSR